MIEVSRFRAAMERSLLSELPEDMIYHICSYLANQDTIRLSLASKQMRGLIEKRPTLVFIKPIFPGHDYIWRQEPRVAKELIYMHSTLERYHRENIPLETFTLKYADCYHQYHGRLGSRCIELAARKGLRILKLNMDYADYVLYQAVFEIESLVELELRQCHLIPLKRVVWPNLKRLSLTHRCVASEEAFENMIRGCPLIENLELALYFDTSFTYNFSHLGNLKQLNVRFGYRQRLEVNAGSTPNLESIICVGGHLDLGNTKFPKLRTLNLCCKGIDEHFFTNFACRFPVLESLSLEVNRFQNPARKRMNLSSTSLKEIRLKSMEELQEACFEVANLRFEYQNPGYNKFHLDLLSFTKKSGRWSCCIDLTDLRSKIDALWFVELNELLAALNGSENSIVVVISRILDHVAYHSIKESVISSVPWIREFSIDTTREFSLSSASVFLDAIFLICQPQTITFLNCSNYEFPSLLYEKLSKDHSGGVTDFEMFQGGTRFKDWDKFLEVLEADDRKNTVESISFRLKYSRETQNELLT